MLLSLYFVIHCVYISGPHYSVSGQCHVTMHYVLCLHQVTDMLF